MTGLLGSIGGLTDPGRMSKSFAVNMPNKKSDLKQARIALKKLRALGLYTGDLRKAPTKAALKKIEQFKPVLTGKATIVQPKNPGKFKNIFQTVGKNVIVPRRKGERISVDKKTGEIVSKRKVGKRTVTTRGKQIKRGQPIPKPAAEIIERVQYAIPLKTSGGGVFWHRFPSWDLLQKFMTGYDYKGWQDFVVVETVGNELDDDELTERLERKRKGRRIAGGVKKAPAKRATKKPRK